MGDKCCGRNIIMPASRIQARELQRLRDKERSDACRRVGCRKMTTSAHPSSAGATGCRPASRVTSPRGGAQGCTGQAPRPGLRRAKRKVGQTEVGDPRLGSLTDGHLREEAGSGTARPAPRHALPPWVGNPLTVLTGWGPRTERRSVAADCREMRWATSAAVGTSSSRADVRNASCNDRGTKRGATPASALAAER